MQRIKISEQDLNRIINESVKKVLKEGSFYHMDSGYGAMKKNLGQTKGQGFGTRVSKAVTAGNQGRKLAKANDFVTQSITAFKGLRNIGVFSNEEIEACTNQLYDILQMIREKKEIIGL